MTHVSGLCTAPIVTEAKARGFDPRLLASDTGERLESFADPRARVRWSSFVPFAARATKMLGEDTIQDLAARATVDAVPGAIRRALPRLTDSRPLFHLAPRWWGPWIFRGSYGFCESLPDGRLREVVRIRPEHESCPEFLAGLSGTLRAIPRLTGQPDALVDVEHDDREAEFLITPPPRVRFRDRLRPPGARRSPARELEEIGFARETLLTERRSLYLVSAQLDREQRHRSTLDDLAQRLLRDEPAHDTKALLDDLVRIMLRRDELIGVRLSFRNADGQDATVAEGGRRSGLADRTTPLRVGGQEIGELALWATLEGDDLEPLAALEAWIAVAVEFGRSRALNETLRQFLDESAGDWRDMETRLERLVAQLNLRVDPD